ncbi:MAG: SUMF1/EgtB/PvdO family nonheme iron enzyme [Chloroflexi bacterium]|nr:SUMF1/EgtB/PvdO family nonheme iron enzyme [Chloroflexota bacterium]
MGPGRNKVLRGGSFSDNETNIRTSNRNNNTPTNRNNNIGFRCVGVAPRVFLKGQVRRVYGRGASAEGEKVQTCSRLGSPFLMEAQPKIRRTC